MFAKLRYLYHTWRAKADYDGFRFGDSIFSCTEEGILYHAETGIRLGKKLGLDTHKLEEIISGMQTRTFLANVRFFSPVKWR